MRLESADGGESLVPLLPPCDLDLARARSTLDQGESEDWVRVQEGRGLELGDVEIG